MMNFTRLMLGLGLITFCGALYGCAQNSKLKSNGAMAEVTSDLWQADSPQKLNAFMKAHEGKHEVAVFDWDNTIAKNDIGDATFFWLLRNDGFRHPANWQKQNGMLTKAAVQDLNRYCPGKPGEYMMTSQNLKCTDTMLAIYLDGKTKNGKSQAWKNEHPDEMDPARLWTVQLLAGYTPLEVREIAKFVIEHDTLNPISTTQKLGSREVPAYMRVYDAQKQLIEALKANGFDVWIATASAQALVETFASEVGISADHVIGVRNELDANGKYSDTLEGCGPYPNGNRSILTYRMGERCFINKIIFKIADPKLQMESKNQIAFAAGDSDADISFVKDASFHLVINRNQPELMCNALQNADHQWVVHPMFIEPKAKRVEAYSCQAYSIPDQIERP